MSGVRRDGTYQFSASDSTCSPHFNRTRRKRTGSCGLTPQDLALLGRGRLIRPHDALGNDARRLGELVSGAPAIEGRRGAVVAQEVGVEGLQQSQCFEARYVVVLPGRRRGLLGAGGKGGKQKREESVRHAVRMPCSIALFRFSVRLAIGMNGLVP
ncbi:MAG: hypothetical protein WDN31_06765 [Hyphomicrobium sp.]